MAGLLIGVTRFIWESVYGQTPCGETQEREKPPVIADVHYLHFGIMLFGIVFIVCIVVSLFTKPIDKKHVSAITLYGSITTEKVTSFGLYNKFTV